MTERKEKIRIESTYSQYSIKNRIIVCKQAASVDWFNKHRLLDRRETNQIHICVELV